MTVSGPEASRYLEVERKFDVDPSAVSPSFEGVAAVTRVEKSPSQTLAAVYFDTPAQDLASQRITLRRRTGGPDAGWHLKLPAGPDARTEIRAPLSAVANADQDTVPGELLDVVAAIVRDRALTPVAQITTAREVHRLYGHDGAALAEFCDDRVTARATRAGDDEPAEQQWREWELELICPDADAGAELLDRLSDRLLNSGATPAGHGSKLARVLDTTSPRRGPPPPADPVHRAVAQQIDQLLVWDRAVRADADDAVHQMRVTLRKLRSLLGDAQFTGLGDREWLLEELRQLGNVLGAARDAEVLAQRYQRALDALPPELVRGRVRQRLLGGARRRYRTGLRRCMVAMRSPRYFRLLDALDAVVVDSPAAGSDQEAAPATIAAAYRGVRKAAKVEARSADDNRDAALHRIRKRAKRLRYIAAATGATQVSERAKAIQTLLGDHQDSVVSREHLRQQSAAAHAAGEDTFTYGLLYQQDSALADRCRHQLDAALRALDKSVRKGGR